MTLVEINALSRADFVRQLGWVFEGSPWVADRTWHLRPFDSFEQLRTALSTQVERATISDKLQLLRAHPDLGARGRMSTASTGEQSKAGLDQLTADEYEALLSLNATYREKFGYPFLFAVKGSNTQDIIKALRQRIDSLPELEFDEAILQACRIAAFRLEDIILKQGR